MPLIKVIRIAIIKLAFFDKRVLIENNYAENWNKEFAARLKIGRAVQGVFGNKF